MFVEPDKLLRSTKGSMKERPLPLLFQALFATRRTAGLELKRQALEKVLVFEGGVPVGCSSNLVHESIGRYLVDKKALTEPQYHKVLALSARREARFEKVLLDEKLVDPQALQRLSQANLAQKILDAFRWTDATYRLVGDVEIDPDAPRMNAPQMLYTAVCSAVPKEIVVEQFPFPAAQRFALVHEPPLKIDELKLAEKDTRLADAVRRRASLTDLQIAADLDDESVRRRLWAWSLLGVVDKAENVPVARPRPPAALLAPVAPPRPDPFIEQMREASRRRRRIAALVVSGAVVIGVATWALSKFLQPPEPPLDESQVVFEVAPRTKPLGASLKPRTSTPLPVAPLGAKPYAQRARELAISASGIALETPEPLVGRDHYASIEASRLLSAGKAAEARAIFERLAKDDPVEPRAPYGAALADFLEGKDEPAREGAAKALSLAPEYADAHLLAGYLDQLAGRADKAAAHYQELLKTEPASPRSDDVKALLDRLAPGASH